jgi:hypothetical protein
MRAQSQHDLLEQRRQPDRSQRGLRRQQHQAGDADTPPRKPGTVKPRRERPPSRGARTAAGRRGGCGNSKHEFRGNARRHARRVTTECSESGERFTRS